MKLAILDDYQNIALKSADWSSLGNLQIKVFDQAFESIDDAAEKLLRTLNKRLGHVGAAAE